MSTIVIAHTTGTNAPVINTHDHEIIVETSAKDIAITAFVLLPSFVLMGMVIFVILKAAIWSINSKKK